MLFCATEMSVMKRPLSLIVTGIAPLVLLGACVSPAGQTGRPNQTLDADAAPATTTPFDSPPPNPPGPANATTTTAPDAGSAPDANASSTPPPVNSSTGEDHQLPYATPVPGKPGYVTSPYGGGGGYVDVRGFPPGTEVQDPYSGKHFLVP
jgi:hypothetical protein